MIIIVLFFPPPAAHSFSKSTKMLRRSKVSEEVVTEFSKKRNSFKTTMILVTPERKLLHAGIVLITSGITVAMPIVIRH